MSGPKISIYELSPRAREIVLGQILCEQQSVICYERIQAIILELKDFLHNFDKYVATDKLLSKRLGLQGNNIEELQALRNQAKQELSELEKQIAWLHPTISAKYTVSETVYEKKQTELAKLKRIRDKAEKIGSDVEGAMKRKSEATDNLQKSILEELSLLNASGEEDHTPRYASRDSGHDTKKIQESIYQDLTGASFIDFSFEDNSTDTSFDDSKAELQTELSKLLRSPGLPQKIIDEIKNAIVTLSKIHQVEYLHSFTSVTVKSIIKKIDAYRQEMKEKQAEFDVAYRRYKMLCSLANEMTKEYVYSEEAFTEMEEEIVRLENAVVRMQEQAYVSECVDQVMTEMGYDLIGSREVVKKKTGKRFRNELYTFNEGTAVNVTYSSDGQISMELGGIAREDRIPSAEETELLTQDMQTFCGEFAEFERRLKTKGVIVNHRIALSPPSAEYAAIINVSDYDVAEGTQITEMQSVDRKKKAAERKVLRRTE